MGVTEMTKLHYLCKKFRGSVMNISADGYHARMDLPYVFSDGFCLAVWDIIHAIVLAHDCAME